MLFKSLPSGTSNLGEEITCFKNDIHSDKYIYLMAGVHGDEVEGVYVLNKLFEWLKGQNDLNTPLLIIPILNVDGYRQQTRVNATGVDLNRNLPSKNWSPEYHEKKYFPGNTPLSEPENIYLLDLFKKYPPKLIISFHSWKPMLNFNGDCQDIAHFLSQFNGYPVVGEIEDYPTPGSLGEYGPQELNSPVLTWEMPLISNELTLDLIWSQNRLSLEKLFKIKFSQ